MVQSGIAALGALVLASGYAGTFIYGLLERALIPFGLHHVFYMPFWQTAVGGTAIIDGVTVTGAQRLSATLQILTALESNDILGEAASVDVTSLNAIELWYGQRYQVNLGDTTNMEYKIACMNEAILQLSDYQTGKLDISFTTGGEQVIYTPFS